MLKENDNPKIMQIFGASFPRSGHSIIYHLMRAYYGDNLVYCDAFNENSEHCGCGQIPCRNELNTFSKNHDFDLRKGFPGTKIIPGQKYLVQYRNPVRSIVSNFHLEAKKRPEVWNNYGWTQFAYNCIEYWRSFMLKWVININEIESFVLICPYENLIQDPVENFRKILNFTSINKIDFERFQEVLDMHKIGPLNNLGKFEFYDHDFFSELEDSVEDIMKKLEIPRFNEGY